jgi:uncharacterized damage-inducible protein DinB
MALQPSPAGMKRSRAMSNPSQIIDDYLGGVQTLLDAVNGMSPEQLKARPVPGKWSTLEVVCHLSDFEPIMADRIKRVLSHDNPSLLGADENRFAATLAYHERDLEEELAIVAATRSQLVRILRAQSAAAFQRSGTHSERGPRTVEQLLTGATNHINHHVGFIAEKRRALGLK